MPKPETQTTERLQQLVDPYLVADVLEASKGEICTEAGKEVYDRLPKRLSQLEVDEIGLRINARAEQETPSRLDGVKNGNKAEVRAIGWIGGSALAYEDTFTTDSVIAHLRKRGLRGKTRAFGLAIDKRLTKPSSLANEP